MSAAVKKPIRCACIQIGAGEDWEKNFKSVRQKISAAIRRGARLIALPENFCYRGGSSNLARLARESTPGAVRELAQIARRHRVAILCGSVIEAAAQKGKFANTSILISEKGHVAARYRKIHLFDVALKNLKVQESRHIVPGNRVVTGKIFGIRAGLTICYDLRFPELFRRLTGRGSRIIFVPANFTETTGKAHWEILLRARAIENQVFIVAPAQVGVNRATGIRSFGTSLVVDPWGKILARGSRTREQVILADLNPGYLAGLRRSFPVLTHCHFKS